MKYPYFLKWCYIRNIPKGTIFWICQYINIDKSWRLDINLWESKVSFRKTILYYRYDLRVGSKMITKFRLRPIAPTNAKYLKSARQSTIYVGRQEFEEVYKSNKWIVPLNLKLDLTIP